MSADGIATMEIEEVDSGAEGVDGGGGKVAPSGRPPYLPPSTERDRLWINRRPARRRLCVKGV